MFINADVSQRVASEARFSTEVRIKSSGVNGSMRRKCVLILDFDLFRNIGGGQTAYRRLIELQPEIDFVYFSRDEPEAAVRPENARAIPYLDVYHGQRCEMPQSVEPAYRDYEESWRIAASARAALGPRFLDVVDVPDYTLRGLFVRAALEQHGFRIGVVALALHGTVSSVYESVWPRNKEERRRRAELRVRERLQFKCVDARYALSEAYASWWERESGIDVNRINPLLITGPIAPASADLVDVPPDLIFVGRRERRKGPDLFVDLAWCLKKGSYRDVIIFGDDSVADSGVGSTDLLHRAAERRGISIKIMGGATPAELEARFRGRSILIVPSRYDQFNLVTLEALRLGCPVFVSETSGAAEWIRRSHPSLSDLIIKLNCSREAAQRVRAAAANYDAFRDRIVAALKEGPSQPDIDTLRGMFSPSRTVDVKARQTIRDLQSRFDDLNRPFDRSPGRVPAAETATALVSGATSWTDWANDLSALRTFLIIGDQRTGPEIDAKLSALSTIVGHNRLARARIFREMARLERRRGRDLTAATYCLRVMRWLGRDVYRDLPFTAEVLRRSRFVREADAAEAMFGPTALGARRCRAFLDDQYRTNLTKAALPLQILDDRRGSVEPKVAVIVSLYNAANKLRTLLDHLSIQSLAEAGKLEVVLVDSGSPTSEYAVFERFAQQSDLPIVFARSANRETIQCAWNRGIALSRAPYLSFLGADEGIHPDCLEILADHLDRRPDIDWAMADSIVTDVDRDGRYVADIMTYDRRGLSPELVRLETCYLSWVGGLYRRSIHDRFGYYDETFKAAGDTEFKSRVLRNIGILHVPKPLGVFNNYPEDRTTASPAAEIEDLRAWYIHRTCAGIAYSYDGRPISEAWDLFQASLTYRKSFCEHFSTDFDVAAAAGAYLESRVRTDLTRAALRAGSQLLESVRSLDGLSLEADSQHQTQSVRMIIAAAQSGLQAAGAIAGQEQDAVPNIVHDNRYEQHWWSWS